MSEIASFAEFQSSRLQSAKGLTPAVLCSLQATGVASDSLPVNTDVQAINNIAADFQVNGCVATATVKNFSSLTLKSTPVFTAPETARYRVSVYTEVNNLAGAEDVDVGLWPVAAGAISQLSPISALKVVNYSAAGTNNSIIAGHRTAIVPLVGGATYCFAANTNTADNETIAAFGNVSFTASIELLQ